MKCIFYTKMHAGNKNPYSLEDLNYFSDYPDIGNKVAISPATIAEPIKTFAVALSF